MADSYKVSTTDVLHVDSVFDVDPRTGFMPPTVPVSRLPEQWGQWEAILDLAIESKLQLGDHPRLTVEQAQQSLSWRKRVAKLPVLPITELKSSNILLRRAHLVLTFLLHFYVQTLPTDEPVLIPRSISLPLLRVSARLEIPVLLTFSDTVLYNWELKTESTAIPPSIDNLRSRTMFTSSVDEEEFYLCSARIELRGVQALELMVVTMDETFIGDSIAVRRITDYLQRMASIINELKGLLLDVKKGCDPERYYNEVRPWFRGEDSDVRHRKWVFQGIEEDPELRVPTELSGPSAGQSSMVHVLDIFLGVDHQSTATPQKPSFMSRMQSYMPHNHKLFLDHLSSNPRPLRAFVLEKDDAALLAAYNHAVRALKEFRDSHMVIAALYILGPARRAAKAAQQATMETVGDREPLKGTGGTDLVQFLKDTRNRTADTIVN